MAENRKNRTSGARGRRWLPLAALALTALWVSRCTDPQLPALIEKDPQVGFLATLGDVPLFQARAPGDRVNAADFFDTNGVRAPTLIEGSGGINDFVMYYEGLDDTSGNVSAGIGEAQSTDTGFTFGNRRLLLTRRNRISGDLAPLSPPQHLPPAQTGSFDARGVQHPMLLRIRCSGSCAPFSTATYPCESNGDPSDVEECPLCSPGDPDCRLLFYSGPGIEDVAEDDDSQAGIGPEFNNPLGSSGERPIPLVPSGISVAPVPPLGEVARNGIPIMLANKALGELGASVPANEADSFFSSRATSFDPAQEVCRRRAFTEAEFNSTTPDDLNNDSAGLGIEAGPYPWESGGIGAPFVLEDPFSPGRYLMYYTCTEESGLITGSGCEEEYINRICVSELTVVSPAAGISRLVASRERFLTATGDVTYSTPSASTIALPNNIVLNAKNQAGFDDFGVSDPTLLVSRSVLGRTLIRMWYTGFNENQKRALGISGSFDGFDWDANDPELRFSNLVPNNPIIVQAQRARAPTAFFASDRLLRVYYDSVTNGTEPAINLATIVELDDVVDPIIAFAQPSGADLTRDQGCSINFRLEFEDAGGSGIDQDSFEIKFDSLTRTDGVNPATTTVEAQNDITLESLSIGVNEDWSDQWPSFNFGASDSASVQLRLNSFRLNPVLPQGDTAALEIEVIVFDRAGNVAAKTLTLNLVESGVAAVCNE